MKRLMLGVVIATLSAISFADDDIDVKKAAKAVCKNSKVEARTACEDLVISTATTAFAVGQLAGICEYAIGINAEPELVQRCKIAMASDSDILEFFELKKERQEKYPKLK